MNRNEFYDQSVSDDLARAWNLGQLSDEIVLHGFDGGLDLLNAILDEVVEEPTLGISLMAYGTPTSGPATLKDSQRVMHQTKVTSRGVTQWNCNSDSPNIGLLKLHVYRSVFSSFLNITPR